MSFRNGEGAFSPGAIGINCFALVSYLPDPLAQFLDRLRTDLVDDGHAKAHVTVLPPRPFPCPVDDAWSEVSNALQDFQPFHVELGEIEIFPVTQVVYLSVKTGGGELKRLHRALNRGRLAFREAFDYHPHVTLAPDLELARSAAAAELAARRWREFAYARGFQVDKLTLVQNAPANRWIDLRGCRLAGAVRI